MLMNIYATLYQYNGMHQINVIPSEQKILLGWGGGGCGKGGFFSSQIR